MPRGRVAVIGLICLALCAPFFPVLADSGPVISPSGTSYLHFPQLQYNYPTPYYQTALKDADQTYLLAQVTSDASVTTVTVDLSSLGGPSALPLTDAGDHHTFQTDFFTIHANGATETKTATITATDANGAVSMQPFTVTIDNTPPVISMIGGSIASSTIADFTPMYLSGSIDGTGSQGRIFSALVRAVDSSGAIEQSNGSYDLFGFDSAQNLKDLRNGSFENLPVPIFPSTFDNFDQISALDISFLIKDEAGNIGTTSLRVPIQKTATSTGASSVLFLPGIEGSVLKDGSDTLWPPTLLHVNEDLNRLSFDSSGNPVDPNVTVGTIMNTFDINTSSGSQFFSLPVYQGFSSFMDGLAAPDPLTGTSTIKQWLPLAYDWRRSPDDIVANGITLASGNTLFPVHEVERLASSSYSGKVTIIAHSYGGLVGKALVKALVDKGEGNLIDSFIFIDSPQLGTPQTVGGLLHGEGSDITAFYVSFLNKAQARTLALTAPSAYDLLPSAKYFQTVSDSPVTFATTTALTESWRTTWGNELNTPEELAAFMSGSGPDRPAPSGADTQSPAIANPALIQSAEQFHSTYDNYIFPSNIRVVQLAGWGLDTIKGIQYTEAHGKIDYRPLITSEGDKVVVYPSALSSNGENYFMNLFDYNESNPQADHTGIVSSSPVKTVIKSVLLNNPLSGVDYISTLKPPTSDTMKRLLVSVHSPMTIGVLDSQGNYTGITPNQDPNADIQLISNGIPGSQYLSYGEGKYILLPEGDTYSLSFQGTGAGAATVNVDEVSNGSAVPIASYSDVPVSPSTKASLTLGADSQPSTSLQVDQNGDGSVDTYITTDGGILSLDELLTNLSTAINSLTVNAKLKNQLLSKLANLKKKIAKQQQKQSTILARLQSEIQAKSEKGRIDTATAAAFSSLLDDLTTQSATIPLNPETIQQLKDQITHSTLAQALKTSLLSKLVRLENLSALNRTLSNFIQTISKKSAKGLLSDADSQNLLNLLDQIQSAI